MKSSRIPIPLLLVLLTVLAGCASGAGTQSGGGSGVLDLADLPPRPREGSASGA